MLMTEVFSLWRSQFQVQTIDRTFMPTTFHFPFQRSQSHFNTVTDWYLFEGTRINVNHVNWYSIL